MANALVQWSEKRMNPFQEITRIEDTFDRLFNEMMSKQRGDLIQNFNFSPSCDIVEETNSYVLKVDLPGVEKDQVKVEVNKDQLTIHAERKEEKATESKKKYLSEVCYGSYTRSFALPGIVDEKRVDAKFDNGVLTVTIPKTEALKAKQIPIH
ncbi:MAG: Hsp20/alpha crystallin family protein [Pseudobdellovibrio sp.]